MLDLLEELKHIFSLHVFLLFELLPDSVDEVELLDVDGHLVCLEVRVTLRPATSSPL